MAFRLTAWQEIFELDGPSGLRAIRKGKDMTNAATDDLTQMVRTLEKSGDYRVLRRLVPRDLFAPVPAGQQTKVGVIFDVGRPGHPCATQPAAPMLSLRHTAHPLSPSRRAARPAAPVSIPYSQPGPLLTPMLRRLLKHRRRRQRVSLENAIYAS